ncbi:hypothetical protein ACLMAJ_24700 [Nocardia sp. KC 131]
MNIVPIKICRLNKHVGVVGSPPHGLTNARVLVLRTNLVMGVRHGVVRVV